MKIYQDYFKRRYQVFTKAKLCPRYLGVYGRVPFPWNWAILKRGASIPLSGLS